MEQNDFNSLKEEIIDTKFSNQIINEPKMIGGLPLGKLEIYRDGYRKRKINSNGTSEVEIKGPSSLIKQFEKKLIF